jgi:hypothetical protein
MVVGWGGAWRALRAVRTGAISPWRLRIADSEGRRASNRANSCRFCGKNGVSGAKQSQIDPFLTSGPHYPMPNRKYSITEPKRLGTVSSFVQSKANFSGRWITLSPVLHCGYEILGRMGWEKAKPIKANLARVCGASVPACHVVRGRTTYRGRKGLLGRAERIEWGLRLESSPAQRCA